MIHSEMSGNDGTLCVFIFEKYFQKILSNGIILKSYITDRDIE